MPYRPIDLQVSIPRTQETGNQQSYLQGRQAAEARMQAEQAAKQTELDRGRSTELERSGDARIGHREKEPGDGTSGGRERPADHDSEPDVPQAEHPFKGRRLDIRL
ncbi:hypothetical protein M3223_01305 [Paenibacillus pasadenensis]|uniref:hypothetical protein n=1 Tax=Paenibacillus pasadenensis TaxID=217090 RepID=UPI00203E834D|nr:hypothetical protein [Paenibacillus pasadenensis]MCM3745983.1 hypothetical protein [Paenibacillus pasadenensis]